MKKVLLALLVFILVVSYEPDRGLRAQVMGQAVTFQWEIPTENEDGTPLLDLAGFKLYQSAETGVYTTIPVSDIANPGIATYVLEGVSGGLWYFVVTAYNVDGLESAHSNEVAKTIVGIRSPPKAPAAFRAVET